MSAPLVVLDTGVVVAALIGGEDGPSYRLCRAVGTGEVRLAVSDRFLWEVVHVVKRKYADGLIQDAGRTFEVALDLGFHAEHHNFVLLPWPSVGDPLDWWMPDLAYHAEADFIVTWDRHVLDADLPIPIEVLTPPELLERLRGATDR